MRRSRALALTVALVSATLLLAGCEKPNPGVSVWATTTSEHQQALCWSNDPAKAIDNVACSKLISAADTNGTLPTITFAPGMPIGISVDVKVADAGWTIALGSQRLVTTPLHTTYWRFTYPELTGLPKTNTLSVFAVGPSGSTTRGAWVFKLQEQNSATQ